MTQLQTILSNPNSNEFLAMVILIAVWTLPWKAWALWKAGKNGSWKWFIALLVLNTLAILEILYIFVFSKKGCHAGEMTKWGESKKYFSETEAKEIGDKLGIKWDKYDVEQFRIGLNVELEHGTVDLHTNVTNDDPILTGKIALAHLNELPDYYTRLAQMEKEGEVALEGK